jgi:hypothetical protein
MECHEIQPLLAIQRDLPFAQQREVKAHLATCAACSAAWMRQERAIQALHALPAAQIPLPPRVSDTVHQALASPIMRAWKRGRGMALVGLALCIGLLVFTFGQPLSSRFSGGTPGAQPASNIQVEPVRRLMLTPYVYEPHIAVDPNNPQRLAAVAVAPDKPACTPATGGGLCKPYLVLSTSTDGGATWNERRLEQFEAREGMVAFGASGRLYVTGSLGRGGIFVYRLEPGNTQPAFKYLFPTSGRGIDNPWLTIDRRTGTLYLTYRQQILGTESRAAIQLQRSTDGGDTWSEPVVVTPGPVMLRDGKQKALAPMNARAMPGDGGRLAVAWMGGGEQVGQLQFGVWVATSIDDGKTFSAPQRIGETWGATSAVATPGAYHVFFQSGPQQQQALTEATSRDGGKTWSSAVVSQDIPLYAGSAPAPGVGVAPDGTLDITFYAATQPCTNLEARSRAEVERQGWLDTCDYDVYYSFSRDGGQSWAQPKKLNGQPIMGQEFVQFQGYSMAGQFIGTASTDKYAYPVWIEGTQARTTRIQR